MHPKTIDSLDFFDGDYVRLTYKDTTKFYGKISSSEMANENCVHINDIARAVLGCEISSSVSVESVPLMWSSAIEIECVGGDVPKGGGETLGKILTDFFSSTTERMLGLDQTFQVAGHELYFRVKGLKANALDESDCGDGTYGTVTLDPTSERECTMIVTIKKTPETTEEACKETEDVEEGDGDGEFDPEKYARLQKELAELEAGAADAAESSKRLHEESLEGSGKNDEAVQVLKTITFKEGFENFVVADMDIADVAGHYLELEGSAISDALGTKRIDGSFVDLTSVEACEENLERMIHFADYGLKGPALVEAMADHEDA